MAKRRSRPKIVSVPETESAQAGMLADMVTVKFIGTVRAVLAGRSILHGERRQVTRRQLDLAERARPGEWQIIAGGETPDTPLDDQSGQG